MKILWLPHTRTLTDGWDGQRQYHLWRYLKDRHEIEWIRWDTEKKALHRWGSVRSEDSPSGRQHTVIVPPNFWSAFHKTGYPTQPYVQLQELYFRPAVRRIVDMVKADVVIYSHTHWATGFPPFDIKGPVLLDHVDDMPGWVAKPYVDRANALVAVSEGLLQELGEDDGKRREVIHNGVDSMRSGHLSRAEAKAALNLSEYTVVSLIGLTCDGSYYFVDAIAALQNKYPNLMLLIVGGGVRKDEIAAKAQRLGIKNFIATGSIPNDRVATYFAATDVGLYPGKNTRYYYYAAPLKIVEYSAASAQVVTSAVKMFESGWSNVQIADDNADAFRVAIDKALTYPQPIADVTPYHWDHLADRYDAVLRSISK